MLRLAAVAGALALVASVAFAQDKPASVKKASAPRVGDVAATFKLKSLDGKSETDLASFRGKKPVILFFGSYT